MGSGLVSRCRRPLPQAVGAVRGFLEGVGFIGMAGGSPGGLSPAGIGARKGPLAVGFRQELAEKSRVLSRSNSRRLLLPAAASTARRRATYPANRRDPEFDSRECRKCQEKSHRAGSAV